MAALPNVILIGASKAGTTSLCADLEHHPDLYMFPSKETHFFSSYRYEKGIEYYRSLFTPNGQSVVMEGSPEYSTARNAKEISARIAKHLPDVKLIYMVRHPLERLESEYVQQLANGKPPIDFNAAFVEWSLIEGSLYDQTLATYEAAFSSEQIHVIFFEDYLRDKPAVMARLLDFLGLEPIEALNAARGAANSRDEKFFDLAMFKQVRKIPYVEKYKHLVPRSAKQRLMRSLSKPIDAPIRWDPALRKSAAERLRADAARFLERHGKPAEYWTIA